MRLLLALGVVAALSIGTQGDAEACGGCFPQRADLGDAGTGQSGTVVTDHRMVLAITDQGTTLWDQIQYVGDPAEFAWVLPIQADVVVGLGADEFISALDQKTAPQIHAPQIYCNPPPGSSSGSSNGRSCGCGQFSDDAATSISGSQAPDAGSEDDGVVITHRDAVGPYDTVQIRSDASESIVAWLTKNGFEVPSSVEPVMQKYVDEKYGFLAVRLRPGEGVRAMKPLRVSWPGKTPSLPLRMVAAGVSSTVGLKLFVIGDGRWRPKNFPSFTIGASEISWDFAAARSTYTAVRAAKAKATDDRGWGVESSIDLRSDDLPSVPSGIPPLDGGAPDAGPESGVELPMPSSDDVAVAFYKTSFRRVTRLRAELPVRHLNVDLQLEADDDQSQLPVDLRPLEYTNADGLCANGIAYATQGSLWSNKGTGTQSSACSVGAGQTELHSSLLGLAALALFGMSRRITRRKGPAASPS